MKDPDYSISELKKELERKILQLKSSENELIKNNIKLKESLLFSEDILNNINVVIQINDLETLEIIWANDTTQKLLGYSAEEIYQMGSMNFVKKHYHPDDIETFMKCIEFFRENKGNNFYAIYRVKNKKGKWVVFYSNRSVFKRNRDKTVKYILGVSVNITEPLNTGRQLEDLLKENIRLKNEIIIHSLTKREKQVLQLIARGNTCKKVAKILEISYYTVDTHRKRIAKKIGSNNIASMTRFAVENGLA